jgi:hypothetical protein
MFGAAHGPDERVAHKSAGDDRAVGAEFCAAQERPEDLRSERFTEKPAALDAIRGESGFVAMA